MSFSRPKTRLIDFKFERNEEIDRLTIKMLGGELEKVTHFNNLGSVLEEKGGMETEIKQRVSASWRNCKKCNGVLFNRKIPLKGEQ